MQREYWERCNGDGLRISEPFGGDIFLGVENDGTVVSVPEKAAQSLQRQLINRARNTKEMHPAAYVDPVLISVEGKTVIRVQVSAMPDVFSFKGIVYDRMGDVDVKVTSTNELASMYLHKTSQYTENRIFPYADMADLRMDLLPQIRTMAVNTSGRGMHPWMKLSDFDLLQSAGLYQKNLLTNEEGLTLARYCCWARTRQSTAPHPRM